MSLSKESNYQKYIISNILFRMGTLFCLGAIVQAFMLKIGVTEEQVYLYNSIMQGIQVAVMFVMLFVSDKIKNVKTVVAAVSCSFILLFIVLIIGALLPTVNGLYLAVLFIVAGVSYVGYGVHSILMYVLPYGVLNMEDYGKVTGIIGGIGGLITFGTSLLHSFVVSVFDYNVSMIVFFVLASACLILSGLSCFMMKEQGENVSEIQKRDFAKVLKNKSTYILLIPNFLRGITTGIIGIVTVIAISMGIAQTESASYINVITQLAILIGSFGFAFVCKKLKTRNVLLASVVLVGVFLPCTVINQNLSTFLILYGIMYVFSIFVDTSIPVLVTEIIPRDEIGGYTSIRMMVFTAGASVSTLIITPVVNLVGYVGLLTLASVCLLICGLVYFIVAVLYSKKVKLAQTNNSEPTESIVEHTPSQADVNE